MKIIMLPVDFKVSIKEISFIRHCACLKITAENMKKLKHGTLNCGVALFFIISSFGLILLGADGEITKKPTSVVITFLG